MVWCFLCIELQKGANYFFSIFSIFVFVMSAFITIYLLIVEL